VRTRDRDAAEDLIHDTFTDALVDLRTADDDVAAAGVALLRCWIDGRADPGSYPGSARVGEFGERCGDP
jgi:hypothetical protein